MSKTTLLAGVLGCALLAGCSDDDGPCDPAAQTGCDDGLSCERVQDGEPACFAPVVVRGQVFDLDDDAAIGGARVVATDVNRAAVSDVGITEDDGSYELRIPSTRAADGAPMAIEMTLRADAEAYQSFPGGIRRALPIDTATAVRDGDGPWVVSGTATEIGLIGLATDAGTASITGTVELPEGVGAIVVAEATTGDALGTDAVVGRDGTFAILNLAGGDYQVRAYAPGQVHQPAEVTLADGGTADVDLGLSGAEAVPLSGTVQFANAPGDSITSVVLFVESTFDENLMRGAAPPSLSVGQVTSTFEIPGVPPGRYVVLAAFDDDLLVRDPDSCQAGTAIVHVEVADTAVAVEDSFKITEALAMISPADGAVVEDGLPVFSWVDDSSEDLYEVRVFDSFGLLVWSHDVVGGVSGADPVVTFDGDPLPGGMFYQVRITSLRQGGTCEISTSEDLAGVFFVP